MRPKYSSNAKLCCMDTDSFVYEIEAEDFYRYIAKDVEKSFDISGYSKDDNRPLPIGENKKEIGLMKDELGGKIMTEFIALRVKMYAYRKIDCLATQHEHFVACDEKRCKGTKSLWFLKVLCSMIVRPAWLIVKQYTGSKYCLRIRSMRCAWLISIK